MNDNRDSDIDDISTTVSPMCPIPLPPEQPHGNEDETEQEGVPDLEDVFVEAGALGDMKVALEKAKALKAMLASGLPSKVRSPSLALDQNPSAVVADRCNIVSEFHGCALEKYNGHNFLLHLAPSDRRRHAEGARGGRGGSERDRRAPAGKRRYGGFCRRSRSSSFKINTNTTRLLAILPVNVWAPLERMCAKAFEKRCLFRLL